jgi:P27 family predicted phage terminase small subunit
MSHKAICLERTIQVTRFIDTKPPKGVLNKQGRQFYNRHFSRLVEEGILKQSDYDGFLELCLYYGEMQELRKTIKTEGELITDRDGNQRKNPAIPRLKDCETKFLRLSNRFGLNPSSRKARQKAAEPPPEVTSDYARFLELGKWIRETFYERCVLNQHVPLPEHLRDYYRDHGFGDPDNTANEPGPVMAARYTHNSS